MDYAQAQVSPHTSAAKFHSQQDLGLRPVTNHINGPESLRMDDAAADELTFVHEQPGQSSVLEEDSPQEDSSLDDDDFSDELSSSPSVPDENIDFENVYALHTFLASVEGQASVTKGDSLVLLDDTNAYWWLVRVLKSQGVGYIPAENIETPYERLARLNKHRNVDLTGVTQEDHLSGPGSAAAVSLIVSPVHNLPNKPVKKPRQRGVKKSRSVAFTAPTYYEHSGEEWSDSEEDENESIEQDEEMQQGQANGFDDETSESEPDSGEEDVAMTTAKTPRPLENQTADVGEEEEEDAVDRQPRKKVKLAKRPATSTVHDIQEQSAVIQTTQPLRGIAQNVVVSQHAYQSAFGSDGVQTRSIDEMLQEQSRPYQPQIQVQQQQHRTSSNPGNADQSVIGSTKVGFQRNADDFDPHADTRKIVLTPQIALDGPASSSETTLTDQTVLKQPMHKANVSAPVMSAQQSRSFSGSSQYSSHSTVKGDVSPEMQTSARGGPPDSPDQRSKKLQKGSSGSSNEEQQGKKKSGMFSGLFGRKGKDKKDKNSNESSQRPTSQVQSSGRPGAFSPAPTSSRDRIEQHFVQQSQPVQSLDASLMQPIQQKQWKDHDAYLAEQTLRQQQIEAQQALQHQYGIQRSPGDQVNQFSPRSAQSQSLSPGQPHHRSMRPGSLIGSPGITGVDVPVLNVLRIFAGDSVQSEATFKTVLLSDATSTSELLRQALQRFRFPLDRVADFYLTIKEIGGQEEMLRDNDKPLRAFQHLAEAPSPRMLPSVKRSSVASISSISSNLSTHPAIEKLGMNDFSDDSAVKLYLNRYVVDPRVDRLQQPLKRDSDAASQTSSAVTITPGDATPNAISPRGSVQLSSPVMRFALRVVIHPSDLPDGFVFDPYSPTIIAKAALAEKRLGTQNPSLPIPTSPRDRIILMAANATVSEVIEIALDRFGIFGGLVQGGDEIEDKLSKRRSISRVRYSLMVLNSKGSETLLGPSRKILDAYTTTPLFKQSPTSKEARRRSADILSSYSASPNDIQAGDPVFILRNAFPQQPSPQPSYTTFTAMNTERIDRPRLGEIRSETSDTLSRYATPLEEVPPQILQKEPHSMHEKITAQRAALQATQHAMISAHENANHGVDINLPGEDKLRSAKETGKDGRMRYSYIDKKGTEYDISDIMESEWPEQGAQKRSSVSSSNFQSAPTSPESPQKSSVLLMRHNENSIDDEEAVAAVRNAPLSIGSQPTTLEQPVMLDKFQEVLHKSELAQSEETIDQRINRVLAKVKSGRESRSQSRTGHPTHLDTSSPQPDGRISPSVSTSLQQDGSDASSRPSAVSRTHQKQYSENSNSSDRSSISSTNGPPTPATNSVPGTSFTTTSPQTRNGSALSTRLVYPADLGLDTLFAIVGDGQPDPKAAPIRLLQPGAEELFGPDVPSPHISDVHVQEWYDEMSMQFNTLEAKLDELLAQVVL